MSLFGRKEKKEIEALKSQLTPEQVEIADLLLKIENAKQQLDKLESQISQEENKLSQIKKDIIETDEAVMLQSFGIYTPHYAYTTSDEYKQKIKACRDKQKSLVKGGRAVSGNTNWTVNNNAAKGKKMVADMQKLLLRAFNAECDDAVEHVRFNNIEASEKKINSSADAISKLGTIMGIHIEAAYIQLKTQELHLMHEYQQKKQEEKEAAKELRQKQREEAKVAKELEEARKKLEKEQTHYENALSKLQAQIDKATDESVLSELKAKKAEILGQLQEIENNINDVDYRKANQKAGYVYVISNIGAFGPDVYKIGMTRRLDPQERVDELGDASVPFKFDVHAMIFTDDAPGLEAALHNAFAQNKVNFVNQRREFFNVTLEEIKRVVRENYDKTVEFVDVPPAEQYRISVKMRNQVNQ